MLYLLWNASRIALAQAHHGLLLRSEDSYTAVEIKQGITLEMQAIPCQQISIVDIGEHHDSDISIDNVIKRI